MAAYAAGGPRTPADDYLALNGVDYYWEDALTQLFIQRSTDPTAFMCSYFGSVLDDTNVLLREFDYVVATQRNRSALAALFTKSYGSLEDTRLGVEDMHQLLGLIVRDFPVAVVKALWTSGEETMAVNEFCRALDTEFTFNGARLSAPQPAPATATTNTTTRRGSGAATLTV